MKIEAATWLAGRFSIQGRIVLVSPNPKVDFVSGILPSNGDYVNVVRPFYKTSCSIDVQYFEWCIAQCRFSGFDLRMLLISLAWRRYMLCARRCSCCCEACLWKVSLVIATRFVISGAWIELGQNWRLSGVSSLEWAVAKNKGCLCIEHQKESGPHKIIRYARGR